ncbi:MAG: hypothetical protein IVW56_11735 [Candidatus Binataceae bacterium]|nr:hypothetical protein [Candidatus Binataceae bacterium]
MIRAWSAAAQRMAAGLARMAAGLAMSAALGQCLGAAPAGAAELDFAPTDYVLRSDDGQDVIGRAHFSVTALGHDQWRIRGAYRYDNGESDIEEDTVRVLAGAKLPQLVKSDHAYFNADGSRDREGRADIAAGIGTCTTYVNGQAQVSSAHLNFPADTFSGAAVVIPLRQALKDGETGKIEFHDFNCVPGPKVLAVSANPQPVAPWPYYPGGLVQTDVKPDFGWLNLIVAPFLPEIRAWFDPADDWYFVGGSTSRYYKGIKLMMVRAHHKDAVITAAPGDAALPTVAPAATPAPPAASTPP